MKSFFVFDVESIGLHGEGFAVAGGVYLENGAAQWEFCMSCPPEQAQGFETDREWVRKNVPALECTHRDPFTMRAEFWKKWIKARAEHQAEMAAECLWPVEARFVRDCVYDLGEEGIFTGPYPFHEIASFMAAAGMDQMASYPRTPSEMPAHNPLADARQSSRLLSEALEKLEK